MFKPRSQTPRMKENAQCTYAPDLKIMHQIRIFSSKKRILHKPDLILDILCVSRNVEMIIWNVWLSNITQRQENMLCACAFFINFIYDCITFLLFLNFFISTAVINSYTYRFFSLYISFHFFRNFISLQLFFSF